MDHYKFIAGIYDPFLYWVLGRIRSRVVKLVDSLKPENIIDICCGTGNQLKYLKRKGYDNITGVDISESMLKQASKGSNNVDCENQDATKLRYTKNSFDLGIISLALHEKPYDIASKILEEAYRVIKPGGYLIIVDYLFDEGTSSLVKFPVHLAERFAGKEHYKNFRSYISYGGVDRLMKSMDYEKQFRFHRGAMMLRLYQVEKEQYA